MPQQWFGKECRNPWTTWSLTFLLFVFGKERSWLTGWHNDWIKWEMECDGNARAEALGALYTLNAQDKVSFSKICYSSGGRKVKQPHEWNRWIQLLFAMHITVHLGLIVRKLGLLPDGCQFKSLNRPGTSGLGKLVRRSHCCSTLWLLLNEGTKRWSA